MMLGPNSPPSHTEKFLAMNDLFYWHKTILKEFYCKSRILLLLPGSQTSTSHRQKCLHCNRCKRYSCVMNEQAFIIILINVLHLCVYIHIYLIVSALHFGQVTSVLSIYYKEREMSIKIYIQGCST